jgi:hypothetical protein
MIFICTMMVLRNKNSTEDQELNNMFVAFYCNRLQLSRIFLRFRKNETNDHSKREGETAAKKIGPNTIKNLSKFVGVCLK